MEQTKSCDHQNQYILVAWYLMLCCLVALKGILHKDKNILVWNSK